MRAVLVRFLDNGSQTLGRIYLFDGFDLSFACYTLEPPWKHNAVGESCIPPGRYRLENIASPTHGDCLAITGVPDRSLIRVHAGNFRGQSRGCVLVGDRLADLNADGQQDVTRSRDTLRMLLVHFTGPAVLDVLGPGV